MTEKRDEIQAKKHNFVQGLRSAIRIAEQSAFVEAPYEHELQLLNHIVRAIRARADEIKKQKP